jgi:hypothetical protein
MKFGKVGWNVCSDAFIDLKLAAVATYPDSFFNSIYILKEGV